MSCLRRFHVAIPELNPDYYKNIIQLMVIDIVSTWYIDKPQLKFSPIKIPRPIEEA